MYVIGGNLIISKKSIAALLVLGCSVTSSAVASSFFDKLVTKHNTNKYSIRNTHTMAESGNRSYTDFTGTWVADCGSFQYRTTIKNDAEFITLDGYTYKIGRGLQGFYQSNEVETRQDHTSFEWNEDGSALTMKRVQVSKYNSDNSGIITSISTYTMSMRKGQIILDGKSTNLEDLSQQGEPMADHCVLTKQR